MGSINRKYWRPADTVNLDCMSASYDEAEVDFHCHHGFTISAVECGKLHVHFTDFSTSLLPGEILLLGPDVPQGMDGTKTGGPCNYRTLTHSDLYENPELNKVLEQERNSICKLKDLRLWRDFLGEMKRIEQGQTQEAVSPLGELSSSLLASISKNIVWRFEVRSHSVLAAKKYLDNHYLTNVDINAVSSAVGLSQRHFFRLFKREMGMTPHRYLVQLRINKARRMLREGHQLLHVVHELGFTDQSHFSKTFMKFTGASPGKYSSGEKKSRS